MAARVSLNDLSIWRRPLSDDEARSLYMESMAGFPNTLREPTDTLLHIHEDGVARTAVESSDVGLYHIYNYEDVTYFPSPGTSLSGDIGCFHILGDFSGSEDYHGRYHVYNAETVMQDIGWFAITETYYGTDVGDYTMLFSSSGAAWIGQFRVQRLDLEGYVVYVGVDALPDLGPLATPAAFSQTLPIELAHALPGSGEEDVNVVVRYRDSYGVVSQNQRPMVVTLDPDGWVLPDLPAPVDLAAYAQAGGAFKVLATYPNFSLESYPADKWRIYIEPIQPVVGTHAPAAEVTVTDENLFRYVDNDYAAGLWYIMVTLYRAIDTSEGPGTTVQVTMPENPLQVLPVKSGDERPPFRA